MNAHYLPLICFVFLTIQPEFGDILEFSSRGPCGIKVASHYAIFVGDEKIPGKKEEDNIFDMLSMT